MAPAVLDVKPIGTPAKHAAPTLTPDEAPFQLSRALFCGSWLLVLISHGITVVFNAAVAGLYWWILNESRILRQVGYLGSDLIRFFRPVIYISSIIAGVHALMIIRAIVYSVWLRDFVFGSPYSSRGWLREFSRINRSLRSASNIARRMSSWKDRLQTAILLHPIEIELIIELPLQTFQAYRLSTLVATVWINRLLAGIIILNCWFSPFVHRIMRRYSAITRQLVCVAMDSLLDIVYGIFIPLTIFIPYWRIYDLTLYSFPFINYYRDEWFINAIAENQQLFVTSWLDFAATISPGITLYLRLHEIQRILTAYRRSKLVRVVGPVTSGNERRFVSTRLVAATSSEPKTMIARRTLHILLVVWGLVVAIFHLHSTIVAIRGADSGCIVEMRPWGSNKYTCTVFEVSCSQKHIMGRQEEMDKQFTVVNPDTLQGLVMSNCPLLEVPPRIQEFKRLLQLKIYNSTVIEWDREAGLTAALHPELQVMFMLEVNFTEFPMGLRWDEPLPVFFDFELSGTNLTSVPDEMEKAWGLLQILSIERAPGFTQVPPFVSRLPLLYMLLLTCNSITSIPDDLLTDSNLMYCLFNNNPLERLPEHVGNLGGTTWLGFPSTKVEEIPSSWHQKETTPGSEGLPESKTVELHLFDSPYCNALQSSGPLTPAPGLNGDFMMGWFEVFCHQYFELPYIYPVEAEHEWRATNRV